MLSIEFWICELNNTVLANVHKNWMHESLTQSWITISQKNNNWQSAIYSYISKQRSIVSDVNIAARATTILVMYFIKLLCC